LGYYFISKLAASAGESPSDVHGGVKNIEPPKLDSDKTRQNAPWMAGPLLSLCLCVFGGFWRRLRQGEMRGNYFKTPLPLNWNGFDFSRSAPIATVPDAQIAF
jgi:hypothetical protein